MLTWTGMEAPKFGGGPAEPTTGGLRGYKMACDIIIMLQYWEKWNKIK